MLHILSQAKLAKLGLDDISLYKFNINYDYFFQQLDNIIVFFQDTTQLIWESRSHLSKMKLTRREFMRGVASAGAFVCASSWVDVKRAFSNGGKSRVFKVEECPRHDGHRRHQGMDTLLDLLAENDIKFYLTDKDHSWGGASGIIAPEDVVLIKVNCLWKCRGTTNTDVLRGLIHRILQHPDGFQGEVVIFENGQGHGGFDGLTQGGSAYDAWPDIANGIYINAEEENVLTVDYLVDTVFKHDPVSAYLLDPIRSVFIAPSEHLADGYRETSDVSYPCFTSQAGHRIELREGIWNGYNHDTNLKLINLPVFKHHDGTGITGALKHTYGILSMSDGNSRIRHYDESGIQCGKMWSLVKIPDLNIIDCIWVSPDSLIGYPQETTYRADMLLAGLDPVALDYYTSKHVLYPLGGNHESAHDPDSFAGLINHLSGARDFINNNGGIEGDAVRMGDDNIEVLTASAGGSNFENGNTSGGGGCFISTASVKT
jgi:hypothetical protein